MIISENNQCSQDYGILQKSIYLDIGHSLLENLCLGDHKPRDLNIVFRISDIKYEIMHPINLINQDDTVN